MVKEYITFAVDSIRSRKVRSWLTMIGIFIGIMAVVALFSLGQGLKVAINEQFQTIGTNKLLVTAKGGFGPPGTLTATNVSESDINVVKRVRGVNQVAGLALGQFLAEFNDNSRFLVVRGIPLDEGKDLAVEMFDVNLVMGRMLKSNDKNKILVGYNFAHKKTGFDKLLKLRDNIKIQDEKFEIVGIVEKKGDFQDNILYMPLETVRDLYDDPTKLNIIVAEIGDGVPPEPIAERIRKEMRNDRGLEEDEEDFEVESFAKAFESFTNVFLVVQIVVLGLTAVSLLIGAIGIMNTMYTAVLQRKKEIGILKSIGAKNSTILLLFLIEAGLLGLIGGLIGITLGIALSKGIELIGTILWGTYLLRAVIPPSVIIGTLLFSIIVGAISGALPAYQASKLKPVEALRD